ncbi:RNA polymerase recycling motor HelD [Paenibacillus taichungensis]|uniref:RNA polymerase recycling motor HelD n=1 Tax=Paenibacillus taichungensis TaxID=484184 RepID=UPI002DBDCCFE|nr:RNA polymerase recycling motor HelD [Paenibacillus taichungensis]MEC0110521.1 RNA polymerase recycling motor HelD [Paenibacillus taichungensis]MEC0197763.1 RNA polymerase recycling motor HelD [Paenibacillus taichungensis]
MSTDQQWSEEQQRVNVVTEQINRKIDILEKEVGSFRDEVVGMRKDFWDEVTMNFSEADDVGETSTSMRQQSQVLSDRERSHLNTAAALDKMKRLHHSPYFGRIDFKENGYPNAERIYLGIASLLDEKEESFLVYDWRAPISNLYYDGAPGPVTYHTPSGEISGDIEMKRQFVIRDGRIRFMFDTGVTIGDELLQAVLSRTSDAQMKSIVATIQKEQNRIIRNDRTRMLIVQGAAGSGKTSAALQRVAYLLYKYREHLQADQMVLFSPNPMFNSYVSTVLPELGEENMLQTTFQEYLERRLGREYQLEDPFIQLEYVLTGTEDPEYEARMSGIRFKSSESFLKVITRYKDSMMSEGMKFKPVRFQGRAVVTAEAMAEKFYSFEPSVKLVNRLEILRDWMLKELSAFGKGELEAPWVDQQMDLMEPEDLQRAYQRLKRKQKGKADTFDDFQQEREILARMVVSDRLKPLRKWIKSLRFVDVRQLYANLFNDRAQMVRLLGEEALPSHWEEIGEMTLRRLKVQELAYEDITPYLYLRELLLGFHINSNIRHVIIDEAQDYSAFQLAFMKRLFPRSKITALGDFNQAIYAHSSVLSGTGPLTNLYGPENTEVIELTRSYRSTQEIVEFTRGMVPGGEEIVPFNRGGEKPKVIVSSNEQKHLDVITADLKYLIQEGYESVAVICKTAEESKDIHEALSKVLPTVPKLIKKTTLAFERGVHVIPAYLAKGVEFDAVLIYDGSASQYAQEHERKLFYTACTRAMHLLHVYCLGKPSPFITSQSEELYDMGKVSAVQTD